MSQIWSSDSDFIVYVVMLPKFSKKNQKVLGVNSYVCRGYNGKTGSEYGGGELFASLPPFRIGLT